MPSRLHLDLVGHWRLRAPVEQVWAALADTDGWPHWWTGVHVAPRGGSGPFDGSVRQVRWSAPLHWPLAIDLDAIECLRPEHLRCRTRGAMPGEVIWLLRAEAGQTFVTHVWRLQPHTHWLGRLLRLSAPLLRRLHARTMRAGADGLQRHLADDGAD